MSAYQQFNYPPQAQPAHLSAVQYSDEECGCGNNCGGCCATPKCCVEPACCSRVGKCPCYCTSYTAVFGVSLSALWLALLLLILAQGIPDLYEASVRLRDGNIYRVTLGMWQACGTGIATSSNRYYYYPYQCAEYHSDGLFAADAVFTKPALLNAVRVFTLFATFSTAYTAIAAAIRLAAQQRSRPPPYTVNNGILIGGAVSFVFVLIAFACSLPLFYSIPNSYAYNYSYWQLSIKASAWGLLVSAFVFITIGTAMHAIAHFCYRRDRGPQASDAPAGVLLGDGYVTPTAGAGAVGVAPLFAHPYQQPQYAAHVAYPTQAVVSMGGAPPVHSQMLPHGYAPAAPSYLYAGS